MKFYFNRTGVNIFGKTEAGEAFYNDFFKEYDIDIDNDKYLHFCQESNEHAFLLDTRTIFFSKGRLIVFDAQIINTDKIPYGHYSVVIHKQTDIRSIKVDCDGDYYTPTYQIKIDWGTSVIEFEIQKKSDAVTDCVETLALISKLMKTEGQNG